MKDRLVELLRKKEDDFTITCPRYEKGAMLINCIGCQYDMEDGSCDYVAREADYLLENGVIVPLLQTGQTVYRVSKGRMWEVKIWKIEICGKTVSYIDNYDKSFLSMHIGKGVFLTREEAEAKLKEGGKS